MSYFDDDLPGGLDEDLDFLSLDGGDDDEEEGGDDGDEGGEDDADDEEEAEEEPEEEDEAEEEEEAEDEAEEEDEAEDDAEDEEEEGDDAEEGEDEEDDDAEEGEDEEEEGDDAEEGEDEEDDDAEEGEDEEEDGDDEEDGEEDDDAEEGEDEEEGDDEEDEDDEDGDDEDDDEDEDDEDDDGVDDDDELIPVEDNEIFASAEDFPNATEEDFAEDDGNWTDEDYAKAAQNIFGENEYFGESFDQRYLDLGWEPLDPAESESYYLLLSEQAPEAAQSVSFFKDGDQVKATGFLSWIVISTLQNLMPDVDWSDLNVTVPDHPSDVHRKRVPTKPLPTSITSVDPADSVDLRKYATPVGDQGQTMRCSAFAWTHGNELLHNMLGLEAPPLSCSFTMLQFQQMQGDAKDFQYAFSGGEGTVGGADPGKLLAKKGTAPAKFWPNDSSDPTASAEEMAKHAGKYKLPAKVQPIDLKDLRQVLGAGYPVHIGMNTGEAFQKIGRDGVLDAAEKPSGDHGRHAMLVVGYIGNYFIVKNSWGDSWGDKGYFYVPKKVLHDAEAELTAMIPTKGGDDKKKKGKKVAKK